MEIKLRTNARREGSEFPTPIIRVYYHHHYATNGAVSPTLSWVFMLMYFCVMCSGVVASATRRLLCEGDLLFIPLAVS